MGFISSASYHVGETLTAVLNISSGHVYLSIASSIFEFNIKTIGEQNEYLD